MIIPSHMHEILLAIKTGIDEGLDLISEVTCITDIIQSVNDLESIRTDSNNEKVIYITMESSGDLYSTCNSRVNLINNVKIVIYAFSTKASNVRTNISNVTDLEEVLNTIIKGIDLSFYTSGRLKYTGSQLISSFPRNSDTVLRLTYDLVVKRSYMPTPISA